MFEQYRYLMPILKHLDALDYVSHESNFELNFDTKHYNITVLKLFESTVIHIAGTKHIKIVFIVLNNVI